MEIIVLKPIHLTVFFHKPINYFCVTNSTGDLCFMKRFEDGEKDSYSFNIMIPETYDIYPSPVNANWTKPRKLVRNFVLPEPEINIMGVPTFVYDPYNNGNYATCYQESGEIHLSDSFYNLPEFVRIYIIHHECGHFYYNTEWKADAYADYMYFKGGFNPSQALYSATEYLGNSNEDIDRKLRKHQRILQYQC